MSIKFGMFSYFIAINAVFFLIVSVIMIVITDLSYKKSIEYKSDFKLWKQSNCSISRVDVIKYKSKCIEPFNVSRPYQYRSVLSCIDVSINYYDYDGSTTSFCDDVRDSCITSAYYYDHDCYYRCENKDKIYADITYPIGKVLRCYYRESDPVVYSVTKPRYDNIYESQYEAMIVMSIITSLITTSLIIIIIVRCTGLWKIIKRRNYIQV